MERKEVPKEIEKCVTKNVSTKGRDKKTDENISLSLSRMSGKFTLPFTFKNVIYIL